MYENARDKYLENEILSASPQKLRKLLIDGAIRFCRIAVQSWTQQDFEKGLFASERVRDIFTELLATTQQTPENKAIIDIYNFLNLEVTKATFENDIPRMNNVIRVLEVEQETWHQVCQQLASGSSSSESHPAPHYPANALNYPETHSSSTSWEA